MLEKLQEALGPDAPIFFIATVTALIVGFGAGKAFAYVKQIFRRGQILAKLPQAPGQVIHQTSFIDSIIDLPPIKINPPSITNICQLLQPSMSHFLSA